MSGGAVSGWVMPEIINKCYGVERTYMKEGEPRPGSELTPEQEARKQRYLTNLENIQNSELEDLYPQEMKKREWEEITDEKRLKEARERMTLYVKNLIPQEVYGLYADRESGQTYFVQRSNKFPKVGEIHLDMLAVAKEIAPWASQHGLIFKSASSEEKEIWARGCGQWSFYGNLIHGNMAVKESEINGLGDPKYSVEQKRTFLRNDIAAIVHENTHINNTDRLDFGGPARKIAETAPMAAEYLAFTGKNSKMKVVVEQARRLLRGGQEENDFYNDATLMGMLIMARDEGLLPEEEDIQKIDEGLGVWQEKVESLLPDQLSEYRRKVESEWLLSEDDEKLHGKISELEQQYPDLMNRLLA